VEATEAGAQAGEIRGQGMTITEQQAERLYHALNLLLLDIAASGVVSLEKESIEAAMDAVYEIDGGVYRGMKK